MEGRVLVGLIIVLLLIVVLMPIFSGTIIDSFQGMMSDREDAIGGASGEKCVSSVTPNNICEEEYQRLDYYEQVTYEIVAGDYEDCEGHCYRPVS